MKSLRKPLFAGIAMISIALATDVQASATELEGFSPIVEIDIIDVEEINQRAEALEDRLASLLATSERKIDQYNTLYRTIQAREARLEQERIEQERVANERAREERIESEKQQATVNAEPVATSNAQVRVQTGPSISLDLRTPSGITGQQINEHVLKGTAMAGLGEAFVKAGNDHGVNTLFLLSLGIHESGWGRSAIARDKNNLFGFGAYDGTAYQSAVHFSTREEGINRVAKHLSDTYLRADGRHYGGGFTLTHVNRRYASDPQWGAKIANTMDRINRDVMNK